MNDNYFIKYEELCNLRLNEMIEHVNKTKGIKLSNLRVQDLTYYNGEPMPYLTGVYIFRKDTDFIYVGKCSSMSFTERIPNHFDLREGAWMNGLLKNIIRKDVFFRDQEEDIATVDNVLSKEWKDRTEAERSISVNIFKKASRYTIENMNLILIGFSYRDLKKIDKLERMLLFNNSTGRFPLNSYQSRKCYNKEDIIDNLINIR